MTEDIVTKGRFAAIAGVSAARVTQYLADGQISGEAIVGSGHRARIRVAVAMEQLRANLDPSQHLGANGRARVGSGDDDDDDDTVADAIKRARLEQLELANEHARAVREAEAGRYVRSDGVQQEMGRIAGRMVGMFEGSLSEMAAAVTAKPNLSPREALHILRTTFRSIRERAAKTEAGIAKALPATVDDAEGLL
jgi:hypothetical protein